MLVINPEIVCEIIQRAREFHAKEYVSIPEEPNDSGGDWALGILANYADDLTYQEVVVAINKLEPDQQVELVALMWLGRGDYDIKDWKEALKEAARSHNNHTAEYLISKPFVSNFLEEGLALHGYNCEE